MFPNGVAMYDRVLIHRSWEGHRGCEPKRNTTTSECALSTFNVYSFSLYHIYTYLVLQYVGRACSGTYVRCCTRFAKVRTLHFENTPHYSSVQHTTVYSSVSHTPGAAFQARLVDNEEGVNIERFVFGKLLARCSQRRPFWHRHY